MEPVPNAMLSSMPEVTGPPPLPWAGLTALVNLVTMVVPGGGVRWAEFGRPTSGMFAQGPTVQQRI